MGVSVAQRRDKEGHQVSVYSSTGAAHQPDISCSDIYSE